MESIKLTLDDLQEQHRAYADIIGLDNLIALVREYGGTQIYIPQMHELEKNKKYQEILNEYDGSNIKKLAAKYNVSESTVYRIVREILIKSSRIKSIEGQLSIFDSFHINCQ